MATIGVLTYTLPDGLKLNKNFINKTLNQNNSNITISNNNNNTNSTEKRNTINYNTLLNNNKPNKIINLTNIESLGMIGTDVIVMRTKQKLTPLKEPQNQNIENQKQQAGSDSIKQPPAKKQKLSTTQVKNVTITAMPLSNIINTSNVSTKLPINITTNVTSGVTSHLNTISSNSITVPLNTIGATTTTFLKQENFANQMLPNTTIDTKKFPIDNDKLNTNGKICGTNTKTNQPITTGGRKSTPLPQAVARRNARERNRVKQVNNGFAALRQRIPDEVAEAFEAAGGRGSNKKLSKVETLRMAVEYIRSLERILGFEYPPDMAGSSAGSDGMLSPLHSDDDILFNSTSDFVTNLSERSPQPALTPPAQYNQQQSTQHHQQQNMQSNFIKNENSVIKIESPNTPSPIHQSSPEDRLSSSFDDANNSLYEHEESNIYFTDNLPDITTINGQDYLRIPGTNTYQLITPEMLENEENIHPTESNLFNQKPILNMKTNFIDFNELINPINIHQSNDSQQQLPLPSMPFTSSMLDQQRALQISEYSSSPSEHHLHHQQRQQQQSQSISPLTVNCISDITPALIPSPDQFSSQSSNMSGSSFTTNTTGGHTNNNNNLTSIIDQHLVEQQQQQQLQNERNLLAQLQHLHNQGQQRQQINQQSSQLLKVKIERSSQQHQQIIHRQLLPTNSSQLNGHEFASNHDFSRTTIPSVTAVASNGNNSHIYETINNVVNQNRCNENSTNNNNNNNNEKNKLKIENVKIERNVLLNAAHLTADENMMDAIEWWEANTPKANEC